MLDKELFVYENHLRAVGYKQGASVIFVFYVGIFVTDYLVETL